MHHCQLQLCKKNNKAARTIIHQKKTLTRIEKSPSILMIKERHNCHMPNKYKHLATAYCGWVDQVSVWCRKCLKHVIATHTTQCWDVSQTVGDCCVCHSSHSQGQSKANSLSPLSKNVFGTNNLLQLPEEHEDKSILPLLVILLHDAG
jgi:hypothetical protein